MIKDKNEIPDDKKYILAYGFRRLSACIKLGWETIPAYISSEKTSKDIPIKEIFAENNLRFQDNDDDFVELMQSIKQHGLLEPVGLFKIEDLSPEDFLTLNLVENVHRKNITPYAQAVGIARLREMGLNRGEIAVRLSIPISRIEGLDKIKSNIGDKILIKSDFVGNKKSGKLSYGLLNALSYIRIAKTERIKLIEFAKSEDLSIRDVRLIVSLMADGMTIAKAMKNFKEYVYYSPSMVFNKEELAKIGIDMKSRTQKDMKKLSVLIKKAVLNKYPKILVFREKSK